MSLEQLNAARELVRSQPEQWPVLVRSVLPVGDRPEVAIRQWCASFVADFFRSSTPGPTKDAVAGEVLGLTAAWVSDSNAMLAKLGVAVLGEAYLRLYRVALTTNDGTHWAAVSAVKTAALARWMPDAPAGLQVALIKLAQLVVLASAQMPPPNHILDAVALQAEAAALLDRLLAIFPTTHGGNDSVDFEVLSATLNCVIALSVAVPVLAPRIVSHVLSFDATRRTLGEPDQLPLVLRWTAKLFRTALHPLARQFPAIPAFLHGLGAYCANQSLKRRAETAEEVPSRAKKAKVELLPGPQPYKALYTLVDGMMTGFLARDLEIGLASRVAGASLRKISAEKLAEVLGVVRGRLVTTTVMTQKSQDEQTRLAAEAPPPQVAPEMQIKQEGQPGEATSATSATSDTSAPPDSVPDGASDGAPEGAPEGEAVETSAVSRAALEITVPPELASFDIPFTHVLGAAPARVVARLSARGLPRDSDVQRFVQRKIYAQLVPDFRTALDPLVLWLSEEYYAEDSHAAYDALLARVVDDIVPRLEISDSRVFIRLLSEVPALPRDVIFKMRSTLLDPERSVIAARALKFLIMFKPPCRKDSLDLVREMVEEGVQSVRGILERFAEEPQPEDPKVKSEPSEYQSEPSEKETASVKNEVKETPKVKEEAI